MSGRGQQPPTPEGEFLTTIQNNERMKSMYFITKKDTETGVKFQAIMDRKKECFDAQVAFADKYGFEGWRKGAWNAFGGIASCVGFKDKPNPKIWGKGLAPGEYFPKQSSREGFAIFEEIRKLPVISNDELNSCIGFNAKLFGSIGFAGNNDEYFGFEVDIEWNVKVPDDCEEVTISRYRKLFGDAK